MRLAAMIFTLYVLASRAALVSPSGKEAIVTSQVDVIAEDFSTLVLSQPVALVMFYLNWCTHCEALMPEIKALAGGAETFQVVTVDAEAERELTSAFRVTSFPTILIFRYGEPMLYKGERTTRALKIELQKMATSAQVLEDGIRALSDAEKASAFKISGEQFDSVLMQRVALVEFYAPWCGHCKQLEPEFSEAARQLRDIVPLVKVDATVDWGVAEKYEGTRQYPTLKLFRYGKPFDFDIAQPATASGIVKRMLHEAKPAVIDFSGGEELGEWLRQQEGSVLVGIGLSAVDRIQLERQALRLKQDHNLPIAAVPPLTMDDADAILVDDGRLGDGSELMAAGGLCLVLSSRYRVSKRERGVALLQTSSDWDAEALDAEIIAQRLPLVGELSGATAPHYLPELTGLPLLQLWVPRLDFRRDPKGANYIANRMRRIAEPLRHRLNVALRLYDPVKLAQSRDATHYGLKTGATAGIDDSFAVTIWSDFPASGPQQFVWRGLVELNKNAKSFKMNGLKEWVDGAIDGTESPYRVKSEPRMYAHTRTGLTRTTAATFYRDISNRSQPALLHVHRSSCTECRALMPRWSALASVLEEEGLTVATLDAAKNTMPRDYYTSDFPGILFKPPGVRSKPRSYDRQEKTLSDFLLFLIREGVVERTSEKVVAVLDREMGPSH